MSTTRGDWEKVKKLGEGAESAVWQVKNKKTNRVAVLKERIAGRGSDADYVRQRLIGTQVAQRYGRASNLETALSVQPKNKDQLLMRRAPGETMQSLIWKKEAWLFDPQQNRIFLRALLLAFDQLHQIGVSHGDAGAGNVIYDPHTKTLTLIDYGFSVANAAPGHRAWDSDYISKKYGSSMHMQYRDISAVYRDFLFAIGWVGVIAELEAAGVNTHTTSYAAYVTSPYIKHDRDNIFGNAYHFMFWYAAETAMEYRLLGPVAQTSDFSPIFDTLKLLFPEGPALLAWNRVPYHFS